MNRYDRFQSTRPSRASTYRPYNNCRYTNISIHKALTGLDILCRCHDHLCQNFNPQGPHGPRPPPRLPLKIPRYFNPQGPHGPRRLILDLLGKGGIFQSTRPSRASTMASSSLKLGIKFQSTRPSRASTVIGIDNQLSRGISIHKALTGLDMKIW